MRVLSAAVAALLVASSAAASTPPAETLARLDLALQLLESDDFTGSYTVTTRSLVAKPGGKDPEAVEVVMVIRHRPGSPDEGRLVRATRNGEDTTEEMRANFEREHAKGREEPGGDDDGASVGLALPGAETLGRYRFVPSPASGGAVVAAFSPDNDKADDAVSGSLAWDAASLDPLWVEVEPLSMPRHVKRLSTRVELGRDGDRLWPRRTVMEGLGGFLLIKREFRVEVEVTDVTFDHPTAAEP